MAKKLRSQRRKKGQGLDDDDDNEFNNPTGGTSQDQLSEDHTIVDSATNSFSMEDDADTDTIESGDAVDDLLMKGNRTADQAAAAAATRDARLQEVLSSMDEFATEKRSAKREARLKRLFKALSQYATTKTGWDLVSTQRDSLRMACFYSLRQGTPSEQYAACRVLEVLAVILGADEEAWVESVAKYFERTVHDTTRATAVRVAALRAWAMTVFICDASTDGPTSEQLMDFCEEAAQENYRNEITPMRLRATALDSWALLATTLEDFYLAGHDDVQTGRGLVILPLLNESLDAGSAELRAAAGECMALIHEARLNLGRTDEESENVTEKKYARGSWQGSNWEEIMDEVKQRISELSVESGKSMNKKALKEQRAAFRDYLSTIVDDEAPEEVLSFRNGAQLTLSSWREIIQLNFVRHCLQSGFQIQLLTNTTLQEIFGADGRLLNASDGGLSQLEKRLYLSKGSEAAKVAHLDLTRRRDKRENIKNHFLTADGDDL